MNLQEIQALMEQFSALPLASLELESSGTRIVLKKQEGETVRTAAPAVQQPSVGQTPMPQLPPQAAPIPKVESATGGALVTSPLVGVFYAASAPGAEPFVTPGTSVKKGQTLCLIEAMKMMSEVPAPHDGVIEAVLMKNEQLVEFGTPLFRIREI